MRILVANIGNRNLILDGNYDFVDDKGFIKKEVFKLKTKEIFENFSERKDKVKLNILDIFGDFEKFDKIYLIGTNQGGKYDNQDTIFAANIIKNIIGNKAEVLEFTSNPTDRNAVLYYFKKIFGERIKLGDKLYLFVSGGVPAMKEAMVWAGLSGDFDISILEAINGKLEESKVEQLYLKEIYKKSLKLFIKNYDWFGAEKLLEENKRLFGDKVDFLRKLRYINARFNFDFDAANKILEDIELSLTEEDFFGKIEIGCDLDGIKELLSNIEVTYKKGEYTMLLGKIFRLQESLYRYIFEEVTCISTYKDENNGFEAFVNYIENNNELKNYLIENNVNYSQPNTFVLSKILSYFKNNNRLAPNFITIFGIGTSIDNLKETRNNSIMAHGWKGVSKEELDKEKFLNKLESLKNALELRENIFDKLNAILLEEIKNL